MPQKLKKEKRAVLDIKPVNETGIVEFQLKEIVDLKNQKAPTGAITNVTDPIGAAYSTEFPGCHLDDIVANQGLKSRDRVDNQKPAYAMGSWHTVDGTGFAPVGSLAATQDRYYTPSTVLPDYQEGKNFSINSKPKLESLLDEVDFKAELANAGAIITNNDGPKSPRLRKIIQPSSWFHDFYADPKPLLIADVDYSKVFSEINRSTFHLGREDGNTIHSSERSLSSEMSKDRESLDLGKKKKKKNILLTIVASVVILAVLAVYVFKLKNNIIKESNSAVLNLEQAKENLENLDFQEASQNFSAAYKQFSEAGRDMSLLGADISSFFSGLPGLSRLSSAKNLLDVGKLVADSGGSISEAIADISNTGLVLNPASSKNSIPDLISSLKKALLLSKANISEASELLNSIDETSIPSDKSGQYLEFKNKLPIIRNLVIDSVDYFKFFEGFISAREGSKSYLVLFQNPSELRPTGGFLGSYAILSFENGQLKKFFVDDVYNLDGQLKENIIPPLQLQHITPNWGVRDANWFIDFPASAHKIMSLYKKESGEDIDGVITFSPVIVRKLLEVVGPIELADYDLRLDSSNFLIEIQREIEYGENRVQPKTILKSFGPALLAKLYSAEPNKWLKIFNVFAESLEGKDIIMYFRDLNLQDFVVEKNFGGVVNNAEGSDYQMVTISNIKGSKTDAVTDTSFRLSTKIENGEASHKLEITRKHNGGDTDYGFYNKSNPAYIRVLVPRGSQFISLHGNSDVKYAPLLNYSKSDFIKDPDLLKLESGARKIGDGVLEYDEAGKKEFGFWLVLDPGETKTVEIEYKSSTQAKEDYKLYIQKQPGLDVSNFEYKLELENGQILNSVPELNKIGNSYILDEKLEKDLFIDVKF